VETEENFPSVTHVEGAKKAKKRKAKKEPNGIRYEIDQS